MMPEPKRVYQPRQAGKASTSSTKNAGTASGIHLPWHQRRQQTRSDLRGALGFFESSRAARHRLRAAGYKRDRADPHGQLSNCTSILRAASCCCDFDPSQTGGGGEIRTLGTPIRRTTVFETAAFNRSATPPGRRRASRLVDRRTECLSFDAVECLMRGRSLSRPAPRDATLLIGARSTSRSYHLALWCSITPSPRASTMPPGNLPSKVPNGARYSLRTSSRSS